MKHLLHLIGFYYPFRIRLLTPIIPLLILIHPLYSQDLFLKIIDPESITVCQPEASKLLIYNRSANNLNNINIRLKLPAGLNYIAGSVVNATESNITQLNAPEFILGSLLKNDSVLIKVDVSTNCELYQRFNMNDTFLNKWIVKSATETDSIPSRQSLVIKAGYLVIDNVQDTSAATGSQFKRVIRIRNTGLGSLNDFTYEDRHDSLDITSLSGTQLIQTGHLLKLHFDANDFLKIGNRDSFFDRDESIFVTENILQTSCKVEDIHSVFYANWGCERDTCQKDSVFKIIHFQDNGERAKLVFSKDKNFPACICSDKGTIQSLTIENKGNRTATNIVITLYAIWQIPPPAFNKYGIIRGSVRTMGAASIVDTIYSVHVEPFPDSCKSHDGYTICQVTLTDIAPGEEVTLLFDYMTCLTCFSANSLIWYFDYSYNHKCVLGETVAGNKIPVEVINPVSIIPTNKIKNAPVILQEGEIYTIQNYLKLSKKVSNQYLIITHTIPCPLRLVDTSFLLNGVKPIYRNIESADSTIVVTLIYKPPFNDSLYQEYTLKVDCNYLCRIDINGASNTQFYSSCPDFHLYLSQLRGRICIEAKLTCPDREYDCGICNGAYTEFSVKCPNLPTHRDSVYAYLIGTAEAYRKNYGSSDPDNNRFVDPGVLDTSLTATKTFITGDTLVNDFRTSVVIDDTHYNYDSVVFMITPNPLMAFDTIFSEIVIKDVSTNKTYSCIYPLHDDYIFHNNVPNCDELIVQKLSFGSGFFVPLNPELLNKYGMNLPSGFKFEQGDSINAKIYAKIHNFIGDKVELIKLTYRAFFIDRMHIKPDPFSCMEITDTIYQATLRFKFDHEEDTLLICSSGFELFHARIRGSQQLENLFHHEIRNMYSLDSLKISEISNNNLFSNLIIDSFRFDFIYQMDTANTVIRRLYYPARLRNGDWEIDPALLLNNRFDEAYTILITPVGHLANCAKFGTSVNRISGTYYINGNNGAIFLDPNIANTLTDHTLFSHANTVILFNGNNALTIPPFIYNSTDKISWTGIVSDLLISGGYAFKIFSKNHSIQDLNVSGSPDLNISKPDSSTIYISNFLTSRIDSLTFTATHTYCKTDTVYIISRWLCGGDTNKLQDQCNLDTFPLFIFSDKPFLQLDLKQETKDVVLCDTLPVINLEVYNADKGNAFKVYLDVFIPPGTQLVHNASQYSYPKGSPYQILRDPISLGSNRFRWIFENIIPSLIQNGLAGIDQAPANSILLKLKLITVCDAVVNAYPRFSINGQDHCKEETNSEELPAKRIQIKGLNTNGAFTLALKNPDLSKCAEETTLRVAITKNNDLIVRDSLKILLPQGLHYKPNSLVNIKNMFSLNPNTVIESGLENLYFGLDSTLHTNDSIIFSIKLTGLKSILCSSEMIMALTYTRAKAICSASHDSCDVYVESGSAELLIDQNAGSFAIDSFMIGKNQDSLNYQLHFKYIVKDKNLMTDSLICIGLYEDKNFDQKLDAGDPLIDTFCIPINQIPADGSYNFNMFLSKSKIKVCNYLLASLDKNCICNLDTLFYQINRTTTFASIDSSCALFSGTLGIDNNSDKSYKWTEGSVSCDTCSKINIKLNNSGRNDTTYNFTLLESDPHGCNNEYHYKIKLLHDPIGKDSLIVSCPGLLVQIDAGARKNYIWHGNDISNPSTFSQSFINNKDRIVYLSFKDENNCPSEDTFYIHPLIDTTEIRLMGDSIRETVTGDTVRYCIIGGKTFLWEPNTGIDCNQCPCVLINVKEESTYMVTVKDSFDCPHIFRIHFFIKPPECDSTNVFLPNAFSPNDDHHNDVLYVRSNVTTKIHFGIYSRWGEKVFESFRLEDGWDGTFKGKKLSPDVFGYFLEAECVGNKKYFKKGNISLLK